MFLFFPFFFRVLLSDLVTIGGGSGGGERQGVIIEAKEKALQEQGDGKAEAAGMTGGVGVWGCGEGWGLVR